MSAHDPSLHAPQHTHQQPGGPILEVPEINPIE